MKTYLNLIFDFPLNFLNFVYFLRMGNLNGNFVKLETKISNVLTVASCIMSPQMSFILK